ncbi:cobalamin biosynthesis protein CobD [Clostridia bacterium]|nr:cobalamin biosynthesis protein CobD [Clostridia bacterium]
MITAPLSMLATYLLDMAFGDPPWLYHPIRLIGGLISGCEKVLRGVFPKTPRGELVAGAFLVFIVVSLCFCVPFFAILLLNMVSPWLGFAVGVFWCYQILAAKSLKAESMKVYERLAENDISGARLFLSYIVGRDTGQLDQTGICKATVETVAENTTDGVTAPILFMAVGGAPLAFLYKAVNTMDSMVGYKNEKYMYFGRAAARVDDVFNFIPARLTALFMIVAAKFAGFDSGGAFRIYKRDRRNHKSPNSAQTESVCAGALGIQLAGSASYFGKPVEKPTIGDALRDIAPGDIRGANRLMYATAAVTIFVCLLAQGVFLGIFGIFDTIAQYGFIVPAFFSR